MHLLDSTGGINITRSQRIDHTLNMKDNFVSVSHNACYMCNIEPKDENCLCRLCSAILTSVVSSVVLKIYQFLSNPLKSYRMIFY